MLRRWCILVAMLALAAGTALAAGGASAATTAGTFTPGGTIRLVGAARSDAHGTKQTEVESSNWSGYAGTTGTYTSASASWIQPTGTCKSGDQHAAFWVGLDGYSSETVEQTGSEVDCDGRTPEYHAWYEAYPAASEDYSNAVEPGDHFNASVTYEGSNEFSLYIDDTTRGWSHDTTVTASGADRSSAEVIVEAPCCTDSGGILPLTDFGTISITSSEANGSATGNADGPTEIVMVDNKGRDEDNVSSRTDGENFSATWVRSN
jgi:hypothetical protein